MNETKDKRPNQGKYGHAFPPAPNTAQERLAARKAAKREKMRQIKRRLAKAKREAEAEARKMQKAKKKKMFAQRVSRRAWGSVDVSENFTTVLSRNNHTSETRWQLGSWSHYDLDGLLRRMCVATSAEKLQQYRVSANERFRNNWRSSIHAKKMNLNKETTTFLRSINKQCLHLLV